MINKTEAQRRWKAGGAFWTEFTAAGGHMSRDEALGAAERAGYTNPRLAIASHIRWRWLKKGGDGYSFTDQSHRANARRYAAHRAGKDDNE